MRTTETEVNEPIAGRDERKPIPEVEVRCSGPVTAGTAARLRNALRQWAATGSVRLTVDLERVTVLDAVGIAALVDGRRAIDDHAGSAIRLRVNPVVRRALQDSGTIAVFQVENGQAM